MAASWGSTWTPTGNVGTLSGKTEVRQKLRKLLADRDEGIAYYSENLSVGAYLNRWLDAIQGCRSGSGTNRSSGCTWSRPLAT